MIKELGPTLAARLFWLFFASNMRVSPAAVVAWLVLFYPHDGEWEYLVIGSALIVVPLALWGLKVQRWWRGVLRNYRGGNTYELFKRWHRRQKPSRDHAL